MVDTIDGTPSHRVLLDRLWRDRSAQIAFGADMNRATSGGPNSRERDFRVWGAGVLHGRENCRDLLEALKEVRAIAPLYPDMLAKVNAAIAKATS